MDFVRTTEQELARVLTLLEDDGIENLNAHDLEIAQAYENDAIRIIQERPEDHSDSQSYVGGGYAIDSRGNYREAFWAGTP